jgi:hypothetical protein
VERVREELSVLFVAEIDGNDELLNALTAVSMWPTWSTWREAMNLSVNASRATLARTIRSLLAVSSP